jgi:bacteriorhodopsin
MHPEAASLTAYARWLTIISWCTYPGVYILKMVGLAGVTATAAEQIGYSIADVVAKAVFGVLIWAIAAKKSELEDEGALLKSAA